MIMLKIINYSHISVSAWRMQTTFCRGTVAQFDVDDLLFDSMAAGSVADFNAGALLRWFELTGSDVTWFDEFSAGDFRSRGFSFRLAPAHARWRQSAMSNSSTTVTMLAPRNSANKPPTWPTTALYHVQMCRHSAQCHYPGALKLQDWTLMDGFWPVGAEQRWPVSNRSPFTSSISTLRSLYTYYSKMKLLIVQPNCYSLLSDTATSIWIFSSNCKAVTYS